MSVFASCSNSNYYVALSPRVGPGQSPLSLYFPTFYSIFSLFYFFPYLFLTRFICFLAFSSFPILPE